MSGVSRIRAVDIIPCMADRQFTTEEIWGAIRDCRLLAGYTLPWEGDLPSNAIDLEFELRGMIYRVRDYLPGGNRKAFVPHHIRMNYQILDSNGKVLKIGTMGPGFKDENLPTCGTLCVEIQPGFWLNVQTSEWMEVEYAKEPRLPNE